MTGALPRSSTFTLCFAVALAGAACNTTSPAKDASRDGVDAGVAASSAAAAPPATPGSASSAPSPRAAGSGQACATDSDCRTFSSYCNDLPCACLVLGKTAADPVCSGPSSVRCLVDPCGRKSAACQDGKCVLVNGAAR